jgi:hypothetical protein
MKSGIQPVFHSRINREITANQVLEPSFQFLTDFIQNIFVVPFELLLKGVHNIVWIDVFLNVPACIANYIAPFGIIVVTITHNTQIWCPARYHSFQASISGPFPE